jgi:hypothetical protein
LLASAHGLQLGRRVGLLAEHLAVTLTAAHSLELGRGEGLLVHRRLGCSSHSTVATSLLSTAHGLQLGRRIGLLAEHLAVTLTAAHSLELGRGEGLHNASVGFEKPCVVRLQGVA